MSVKPANLYARIEPEMILRSAASESGRERNQNPDLPIDFSFKMRLVEELAVYLKKIRQTGWDDS